MRGKQRLTRCCERTKGCIKRNTIGVYQAERIHERTKIDEKVDRVVVSIDALIRNSRRRIVRTNANVGGYVAGRKYPEEVGFSGAKMYAIL